MNSVGVEIYEHIINFHLWLSKGQILEFVTHI